MCCFTALLHQTHMQLAERAINKGKGIAVVLDYQQPPTIHLHGPPSPRVQALTQHLQGHLHHQLGEDDWKVSAAALVLCWCVLGAVLGAAARPAPPLPPSSNDNAIPMSFQSCHLPCPSPHATSHSCRHCAKLVNLSCCHSCAGCMCVGPALPAGPGLSGTQGRVRHPPRGCAG
jgi:hypothetical protein